MTTNLGLLYNRIYFNSVVFDAEGETSMSSNHAMNSVLSKSLSNYEPMDISNHSCAMKTVYPGLLCGSGYNHEMGGKKNEGEFQLGYFFDHTTGLPVIPGSSIKGVLRSALEVPKLDDAESIQIAKDDYFKSLLEAAKVENDITREEFIQNVFDGNGISSYQRDIFFDAFPTNSNGSLMGSDYITAHENPLKDPVPVQFLRVQPEVTYTFYFRCSDGEKITGKQKLKIFEQIILDYGLGAKTNVGYGQFEKVRIVKKVRASFEVGANAKLYKEDDFVETTLIELDEEYATFKDSYGSLFTKKVDAINKKFERDLKRKQKKKPDLKFKEMVVGMTVELHIKCDMEGNRSKGENITFTVRPVIE